MCGTEERTPTMAARQIGDTGAKQSSGTVASETLSRFGRSAFKRAADTTHPTGLMQGNRQVSPDKKIGMCVIRNVRSFGAPRYRKKGTRPMHVSDPRAHRQSTSDGAQPETCVGIQHEVDGRAGKLKTLHTHGGQHRQGGRPLIERARRGEKSPRKR